MRGQVSKAKPKPKRNPKPNPSLNQALNELCAGKLDSLTYAQMREHHPEQYTARMDDKLNYRYPGVGGESCTRHTQGSQPPRTSRQGPRQAWQLAWPATHACEPPPRLGQMRTWSCACRRASWPSSSGGATASSCVTARSAVSY